MKRWAREHLSLLSPESYARFNAAAKDARHFDDDVELRKALLDFIADFANWDNSTVPEYLETSRALTQAAHAALGGAPGTKPLVVDPFAGGGSIPLEALRVGADAFASDLNPVAVLLNKVVLEYGPRYGRRLADAVKKQGEEIGRAARKKLAKYYPVASEGEPPAAYLWARTIDCEGPGCGIRVPLVKSTVLACRRGRPGVSLSLGISARTVKCTVVKDPQPLSSTVRKGSVTCPDPRCGHTTPVTQVRKQLARRRGGTADATLLAVVRASSGERGRHYSLPTAEEAVAASLAAQEVQKRFDLLPNEPIPIDEPRRINVQQYGMDRWSDLFSPRQLLALTTFVQLVSKARVDGDSEFVNAVRLCLGLVLGRLVDANSGLATWSSSGEFIRTTFARQAIPFVWDFAEAVPTGDGGGSWASALEWVVRALEAFASADLAEGTVACASALRQPSPDDSADVVFTDPPYYYSVPYSHLSDYFFVWLKRVAGDIYPGLLGQSLTPKAEECVQSLPHAGVAHLQKGREHYERSMRLSLEEARRVMKPEGIATIVFAHTETDAWETMLSALLEAGWMISASWPIDTERGARTVAQRQRTLASSVHLVCRPRELPDGSVAIDRVGSWRDVLSMLPKRLHEWMPRLAEEGVVGADAIFACLGPALEIFSRYSRVEKASGEVVTLKEYLEHVWAAVAKEALSMIFADPETSGLEPDARLTAMWLWTVAAPAAAGSTEDEEAEPAEDDEEDGKPAGKLAGFVLEFDAARKIAQGLGAKLEEMPGVVEVKGEKARLLPVSERARFLFGGGRSAGPDSRAARGRGRVKQGNLFREVEEVVEEAERSELGAPGEAKTTLDRIHQAMLLFGAGRSEALRRFLVDDGAGRASGFWKLAQALSALYPKASEEKRWVDGVLARKKSLGF